MLCACTRCKRLVANVIKAIYGLKQAPRLWNVHVDNTMTKYGSVAKSSYDPCLYKRRTVAGVIYVTIYVDDLIIAGRLHYGSHSS